MSLQVEPSPVLVAVRQRIEARSRETRTAYLAMLTRMRAANPPRKALSCGNLAHAAAACGAPDKMKVATGTVPNLGIVTSYNDMLSAHQPLETYPTILKAAAQAQGATAQVAGGVPARHGAFAVLA